jgi:maleylpyruvate isomerase
VPHHLHGGEGVSAPASYDWACRGQQRIERAVAELSDADVRAPSALPGWSRAHVLTHLARNADALVNLLTWARTGVETPMYAGPEQRDADIEAGAVRGADELRADLHSSGLRFRAAADALSGEQWSAPVRTRAGRQIPASEVPWMRVREVWLHLVDLDVGIAVDDLPDDVAWRLVGEVAEWMSGRVDATVELIAADRPPVRLGTGAPQRDVRGSTQQLAGWLTGRSTGDDLEPHGPALPQLPAWL